MGQYEYDLASHLEYARKAGFNLARDHASHNTVYDLSELAQVVMDAAERWQRNMENSDDERRQYEEALTRGYLGYFELATNE